MSAVCGASMRPRKLPDVRDLCSLEPAGENLWRSLVGAGERTYPVVRN